MCWKIFHHYLLESVRLSCLCCYLNQTDWKLKVSVSARVWQVLSILLTVCVLPRHKNGFYGWYFIELRIPRCDCISTLQIIEWIELNTYIPVDNPISKRFTYISKIHSRWAAYLGRAEPGPNAKINCLFSHRNIFGHFLNFQSSINCVLPCPLLFLAICALHAGYLFVTDTLSTPTIAKPPSVECQDLLIPTRSYACVARIDLGLKSHPNDCYCY